MVLGYSDRAPVGGTGTKVGTMSSANPADVSNYLRVQNGDLQEELAGSQQELEIAREELLAACIGESSALSSLNHMNHYLATLHNRWADPADARSLENVVEQRMADADEAIASADLLALQLRTMEGSKAYRAVSRYRRLIERFLPAGSRRRALYRRLV